MRLLCHACNLTLIMGHNQEKTHRINKSECMFPVDSGEEMARSLPTTVPESPSSHQPRTPRTPRTPGRQDPSKTPRFYPVMKEGGAFDGQVSLFPPLFFLRGFEVFPGKRYMYALIVWHTYCKSLKEQPLTALQRCKLVVLQGIIYSSESQKGEEPQMFKKKKKGVIFYFLFFLLLNPISKAWQQLLSLFDVLKNSLKSISWLLILRLQFCENCWNHIINDAKSTCLDYELLLFSLLCIMQV